MKHKEGKFASQNERKSRVVPMGVMLVVLCGFSFYLGGIFCSEKNRIEIKEATKVVPSPKESVVVPLRINSTAFPECSSDYQDYTPCTDPRVLLDYSLHGAISYFGSVIALSFKLQY